MSASPALMTGILLRPMTNAVSGAITSSLNSPDMNPDVIVIPQNNTVLFEPRTPQAALWLRNRYRLTPETVENNTAIMVHPNQQKQLTAELKAAGFAVSE